MSDSLDDLLPAARELAARLLERCESEGIHLFVTSTLRTFHEQDRLYQRGRTRPGPRVTNARAGESRHNFGLAFDVAFRSPPSADPFDQENPWERVGAIGRSLGLEWGGDWSGFPDRPHFQLPSLLSVGIRRAATISRLRRGVPAADDPVRELQELLDRGGFEPGGVDGDFGPLTEAAVQRLQRAVGLVPTGVVQLRELDELVRLL